MLKIPCMENTPVKANQVISLSFLCFLAAATAAIHPILVFSCPGNHEKLLKVYGLPILLPQGTAWQEVTSLQSLGRRLVWWVAAYLPGWGWLPGPAAQSTNAGR